jgi:hypothetical protein
MVSVFPSYRDIVMKAMRKVSGKLSIAIFFVFSNSFSLLLAYIDNFLCSTNNKPLLADKRLVPSFTRILLLLTPHPEL